MTDTAAEQRQKTMRVRAMRRLSKAEVAGLGVALDTLDTVEALLVKELPHLRHAAEREANVRHAQGKHPQGSYVRAWSGCRDLLDVVTAAREEMSYVEALGKVEKRMR